MNQIVEQSTSAPVKDNSVFERCWWIYAICREYLFTDQTEEILRALGPLLDRPQAHHLLELGCGPGFYARRLGARFPNIRITGVDLSEPLLARARARAQRAHLYNCNFVRADAHALCDLPEAPDAVIASRLFLILSNRRHALENIFTALRPGGLFFMAEPQSKLRAGVPMRLMQAFAWMTGNASLAREAVTCNVLPAPQFRDLINSQPWSRVRLWEDRGYQCALCEKPA